MTLVEKYTKAGDPGLFYWSREMEEVYSYQDGDVAAVFFSHGGGSSSVRFSHGDVIETGCGPLTGMPAASLNDFRLAAPVLLRGYRELVAQHPIVDDSGNRNPKFARGFLALCASVRLSDKRTGCPAVGSPSD